MPLYKNDNCSIWIQYHIITLQTAVYINSRCLFNIYVDNFCSWSLNWVKYLQEKSKLSNLVNKSSKEGFEPKIIFLIKVNYTPDTGNNSAVVWQSAKLYSSRMIITINYLFVHDQYRWVQIIISYLSFLSIRRSPWPSNIFNIGWWCSVPRSEAKVSLGYFSMVHVLLHYPLRLDFPLDPVPNLLSLPDSVSTLSSLRYPPWEM